MSTHASLVRHELARLVSARAAIAKMALFALVSVFAVGLGTWRMDGQRTTLRELAQAHTEQESYLRSINKPDTQLGLVTYYLSLPVAHEPSPWAALAHGQRDAYPYAQQLRLLGLVPQLHDAEIANPLAMATGKLDLAFVLALLLPLLIIGLAYNALSHDHDVGTLPLVRAQPISLARVVGIRLVVRAAMVSGLTLAILSIAAAWTGAGPGAELACAMALALLYIALWFLVVFAVIALRRSSTFNALTLVGLWAVWTIALPALVTSWLSARLPVPDGIELTLRQRQDMNARWDRPKADTVKPFLARRPELASTAVPEDKFSWPWYYAMHEMGDQAVAGELDAYRSQLARRHGWAQGVAALLPALNIELSLSELAGTGAASHLAYRDSIAAYHERLKQFFYPRVFAGATFGELQFDDIPRHRFPEHAPAASLPLGLASLAALVLILAALVPSLARRLDRHEDS